MIDRLLTPRIGFGAAALVCLGLILFALHLQYGLREEPCPLCILQRAAVLAMMAVFAVAAVHNPGRFGTWCYAVVLVAVGAVGAAIAGRHVWLQNLPPERVPECGPGLEFMLEQFPLTQVLALVLRGTGECAQRGWSFLGLTIPGWTLLFFIVLALFSLLVALARTRTAGAGR
jgi:disulfide bond formation protein DsbB